MIALIMQRLHDCINYAAIDIAIRHKMFVIIESLAIKTKLRIIETTICELPDSEDLLYLEYIEDNV